MGPYPKLSVFLMFLIPKLINEAIGIGTPPIIAHDMIVPQHHNASHHTFHDVLRPPINISISDKDSRIIFHWKTCIFDDFTNKFLWLGG